MSRSQSSHCAVIQHFFNAFHDFFCCRNKDGVLTVNEVVDLLHQQEVLEDSYRDPDYKQGMIKRY